MVPGYGGDWGYGNPFAGDFWIDARYQLQTPDGANIYIQANGPQQPSGLLHTRVTLETGHPDWFWLNSAVAIGITTLAPSGTTIFVELWSMVAPPP